VAVVVEQGLQAETDERVAHELAPEEVAFRPGLGLVYNPGEVVEGFSNPVWTLLTALPLALGADGWLTVKALGVLSHAALIAGTVRLALVLGRPSDGAALGAAILGAALAAVSHPLTFWAVQGLETPMYSALLVWSMARLWEEEAEPSRLPLSAVLLSLAALSRPEAPLLCAPVVLARAWRWTKDGDLPGLLLWLALAVGPGALYLLFRVLTFGELLPNTFFRKGDKGFNLGLTMGYLSPWLRLEWPMVTLGGLALLASPFVLGVRSIPVVGLVLAQAVFLVVAGKDWMWSGRFVAPVIAPLAATVGAVGAALVSRLPPETGGRGVLAALASVLVAQGLLSVPTASFRGVGETAVIKRRADNQWAPMSFSAPHTGLEWAASYVIERARPGELIAYTEIGVLGYVTDHPILDLGGLVDPNLSGAKGLTDEEERAYVHSRRPAWILLKDKSCCLIKALMNEPWLALEYEEVEGPRADIHAYRRRDATPPTPEEVRAAYALALARFPGSEHLQKKAALFEAGAEDEAPPAEAH
jgi:arabinofuranosyltransferase